MDTRCMTILTTPKLATNYSRRKKLIAVDGREVRCKGISTTELTLHGVCLNAEAIVIGNMIKGIDIVIGMNLIEYLGSVIVDKGNSKV